MDKQLRCAAVHDLSCFGKCSLAVALPILSAAGIECCCIPTAILSTHTGDFQGYTYRDLTEDMLPVARHWHREGIRPDAFYTGYLGSPEQVEIVAGIIRLLDPEHQALRLIDPVMGDHGRLYSGFTPDFPRLMGGLIAQADVICPNITEASLLTGLEYRDGLHDRGYIRALLDALSTLGAPRIVLTGVRLDAGTMGAAVREAGETAFVSAELVEGIYHGTGDIYGSVLTACLMNGKNLTEAAEFACRFTAGCVRITRDTLPDVHYGVRFEAMLLELVRELHL